MPRSDQRSSARTIGSALGQEAGFGRRVRGASTGNPLEFAVNPLAMRAPPSEACTRFCGDWLDCTGRSHGIACFEVRSDFRFGLAFPFFRLGEPKETSCRIAHCELAKLRF